MSLTDILQSVQREFLAETARIKDEILEVEASLKWEQKPKKGGKVKRKFKLLSSREAKEKTITALREDLASKALEMEEFHRGVQTILKGPEKVLHDKLRREVKTFRKHLPVYRFRSKILESIRNNDVTVLVADTGSGKSTLIPQIIYGEDDSLVIYCAQPRRLAAHGLAEYTKDCLGLGKRDPIVAVDFSPWDTTYKAHRSRVVYTTNYGLLHKWRKNKILGDVDVVVIDEAHERNLASDLLMGIMKGVLGEKDSRKRPIKLVVMSATIDPSIFCDFFKETNICVNDFFIPGKTFPVDIVYDMKTISNNPREYLERTISRIKKILEENESGDILGFLATPAEIDEGVVLLEEYVKGLGRNIKAFPLHGNVEMDSQKALFKKKSSLEEQRVILATKIAETSITLPDIMFVVDSGRQKEFTFDLVKNIGELSLNRISKVSSIQRAGRAGRVGPGVCYRLYRQSDFDSFISSQLPEILCQPLDQSLLSLFHLGFSSPSTFHFIDPPDPAAISVGISSLISLNAIKTMAKDDIDDAYELTALGSKMSHFNIDPRLAHLLVNTIENQESLISEVLVICGMISSGGNVFYRYGNVGAADLEKLKFCHPYGDFVTMLEAFKRWSSIPPTQRKIWAKRNYISSKALLTVTKFVDRTVKQIERTFIHKSFTKLHDLYTFPPVDSYDPLLKLIYHSFKRSIAVFAGPFTTGYLSPITGQKMVLHPSSSINKLNCEYPQYICYDKVLTTNRTSIFHASVVKPDWMTDEEKELLHNDFVRSSLVQRYDNYPRLGRQLLSLQIKHKIKTLSSSLNNQIEINSQEKGVTQYYKIHLDFTSGTIQSCCHSDNQLIISTCVNTIIQEALESAKAKRIALYFPGTSFGLNVGLDGIASELILPGSFLSIKLAMYSSTPEKLHGTVKKLQQKLKSTPVVQFLSSHELELTFTSKGDAEEAFVSIPIWFPNLSLRWSDKQNKSNFSVRFLVTKRFYMYSKKNPSCDLRKILKDRNILKSVGIKSINKNRVQLEAFNLSDAKVVGNLLSGYSMKVYYNWSTSLRCQWTIPSKNAHRIFRKSKERGLPFCMHIKDGERTKVILTKKYLDFPLSEHFISQYRELSDFMEGVSFSHPSFSLLFDSDSNEASATLRGLESKYDVVISRDKFSHSLRIFADEETAGSVIDEIDEYLDKLKMQSKMVSNIHFKGEGAPKGLLIRLIQIYGTHFHKLSLKPGITSVQTNLLKGFIRIEGLDEAVLKVRYIRTS